MKTTEDTATVSSIVVLFYLYCSGIADIGQAGPARYATTRATSYSLPRDQITRTHATTAINDGMETFLETFGSPESDPQRRN